MAKKGKEPAIQCTLCGDLISSHKANSQGSKEPDKQKVSKTPANDTTEHPSEMQTKVAIEPVENGKSPVEDPARNPAVDLVGGHRGNLTGGAQLQLQQNRGLSGDA